MTENWRVDTDLRQDNEGVLFLPSKSALLWLSLPMCTPPPCTPEQERCLPYFLIVKCSNWPPLLLSHIEFGKPISMTTFPTVLQRMAIQSLSGMLVLPSQCIFQSGERSVFLRDCCNASFCHLQTRIPIPCPSNHLIWL